MYVQVATTVNDRETAVKIAKTVLAARLAACVQFHSCQSMFHWEGKVESEDEILCVMKTRADLFARLEESIRSVHSYDVPEIIATEVTNGNKDYLDWMDRELAAG